MYQKPIHSIFQKIVPIVALLLASAVSAQRPNLIVTTDIGQDPDDQQSMVRLLHYANDFNLLGLIANADDNYDHEPPTIRTDLLYQLIDAYDRIYSNLRKVDANYPRASHLKTLVKPGCSGNGRKTPVTEYIGAGKNTEGSDWIIQQVDAATGVVNVSVWGGACDLAQALFDVKNSRSKEATRRFVDKLRVYFIGKQDSSNEWIMENFPDLWLVLGSSHDGNSWNSSFRGIFLGGDMQLTSREWLNAHVIGQHALGDLYPDETYTKGGSQNPYGAMKEGDTPSFLYFLNNGLNFSEHPDWGGWGGRFERGTQAYFGDAKDSVFDTSIKEEVSNAKATVFRWRPEIQADLAARVQWGRGDSKTINHYPAIQINGDASKTPLRISAKPGEDLSFTAEASKDIDSDKLSFDWMIYPEAGTFLAAEKISLDGANSPTLHLALPTDGTGTLHLLLKVKDEAEYPLTSYRRVIVEVKREEIPLIILDTDMGSDCDDVGALAILHQYVKQGKARLLGCIYSSGKVPFGAGVIDAINTYYGKPDLLIGAEYDESFGDPVDKMDAGKLARDTAGFGHDIIFNRDVPEQTVLNRQLLAAQQDHSVTYVTIGHTKALYELLRSKPDRVSQLSGMELVRRKVKKWVALGGLNAQRSDEYGSKDWNFFRNNTETYTDYLLENFPRPAYLINAGSKVLTGQSLAQTPVGSIVRTAYRDWLWKVEKKGLNDGRPSWDLAAVYFAVEGPGAFLEMPEEGVLQFDVQTGSRWVKKEEGTHFYVNQKPGMTTIFGTYLNGLLYGGNN